MVRRPAAQGAAERRYPPKPCRRGGPDRPARRRHLAGRYRPRAPGQRSAEALTGIARLVLDKGLSGGGGQVRPHLSVHVPWDAFVRLAERSAPAADGTGGWTADGETSVTCGGTDRGTSTVALHAPAELDDGTPIPPSVLARIACDSEIGASRLSRVASAKPALCSVMAAIRSNVGEVMTANLATYASSPRAPRRGMRRPGRGYASGCPTTTEEA